MQSPPQADHPGLDLQQQHPGLMAAVEAVDDVAPPEQQNTQEQQPFSHLRLRGLPFAATEADIRAFFGQFELAEVFICKRNGRSNGEAFVQLSDPSQGEAALEALNRQHMGQRYIELFTATPGDLETAKSLQIDRLRGYVVRMRGLPYSASASDVLRFLNGIDVVRGMEGVIFTWTPDGRPTGEAFVELKDEAAQSEAMKRHKELMGTRYIEMFTSTKAALVQAIQHNRLILGFSNRKKWLQQAGVPTQMLVAQQPGMYQMSMIGQRVPGLEDVTDGFAGMGIGGQGVSQGMGMVHGGPGMAIKQGLMQGGSPGHAVGRQDLRLRPQMAGLPQPGGSRQPMQAGLRPDGMHGMRPAQQVMQSTAYVPAQQAQQANFGGLHQQPYLIQQPGGQYVTIDNSYGNISALGGSAQDQYNRNQAQGKQMQGQYIVNSGQGNYALQAIQLPGGQALHEYLQLGGGASAEQLQGGYVASNLPLGMQSLPDGNQQSNSNTSLMLHPQ